MRPQSNEFLIKNTTNSWLYFNKIKEIIIAKSIDQIIPALERVEELTKQGFYSAGFLSYEAARAFDEAFSSHEPGNFPLLWFGIYHEPVVLSSSQIVDGGAEEKSSLNWSLRTDFSKYREQIKTIKKKIAEGQTYQVNHTIRLHAENMLSSPYEFFKERIAPLDSQYSAFWQSDEFALASGSPELFFEKNGQDIKSKPMKGTRPRGLTSEADKLQAASLKKSQKDQAENVMIVDMIRNDMGRISANKPETREIFSLEKYSTVWQMTSTISAKTDATLPEIFSALFPCASITGAPKVQTMKIIKELEDSPRGIYTGCIGYITPEQDARFNVAIRTASFNRQKRSGLYGVGGGIVWDSEAEDEYNECKIKAAILSKKEETTFQLFETMLFEHGSGIFLFEEHLNRLSSSCDYFNFKCDIDQIRTDLAKINSDKDLRLRLLVSRNGRWSVEKTEFNQPPKKTQKPWKLQLASEAVSSKNIFLYHKTTEREVYDRAKSACSREIDDVVLYNERGEITETTITNIVVLKGNTYFTPDIKSGLLNGTFRDHLIKTGEIEEKIITVEELKNAEEIWLINSLRKWIPAQLP